MKVLIWIKRLLIDWACVCSAGTSMIAAQTISNSCPYAEGASS